MQEELEATIAQLIDMFGDTYGWTVSDVLDLTLPEVNLLQDALIARVKRMERAMEKKEKGPHSNAFSAPRKKLENVLGKYKKMGLVEG